MGLCCVQNEPNKKRPEEKRAFLRAAAILTNITQSDHVTFMAYISVWLTNNDFSIFFIV